MSRTWAGTPVHIRRQRFSDNWEVIADEVVVGIVWRVRETWAWTLHNASDASALGYPTRARAVDALLAAHSKAVDAWATP